MRVKRGVRRKASTRTRRLSTLDLRDRPKFVLNAPRFCFQVILLVKGPVAIPFMAFSKKDCFVVFVNTEEYAVRVTFPASPFKAGNAAETFTVPPRSCVFRVIHGKALNTSYSYSTNPPLFTGGNPPDGPAVIVG
jgi:hypothetical protein